MSKLTIVTGSLGAAEAAMSIRGIRIIKLPVHESGSYEAFIRRTNLMREHLQDGRDTVLVEPRALRMDPFRQRMLARIALGLGVEICGEAWCGIAPGKWPDNPGPGIGNWGARILVAGDAPNHNAPEGVPNWPFISSNENGCAAWFADQLCDTGVEETDLYWINAGYLQDGVMAPTVSAPLVLRDWRAVVTLGRAALDWARDAGFQGVFEGYHPSYWWSRQVHRPYGVTNFISEVGA